MSQKRHIELVHTLGEIELSKLILVQNSSTEMLRLRNMIEYLSSVQQSKQVSMETLQKINAFNIADPSDTKIDDSTLVSLRLYHKEHSSKLSIAELEQKIETLKNAKLELINNICSEMHNMRNTIKLLTKTIQTSFKLRNATYKYIQYLFDSDIACILLQYCSCDTIIAIYKSHILNKDTIDYTTRFKLFTDENNFKTSVQYFKSNMELNDGQQRLGGFYGIQRNDINLWNVNIKNITTVDDKKLTNSILENLHTLPAHDAHLSAEDYETLKCSKKTKGVIQREMKKFNRCTRNIKQKKVYVMYFLSAIEQLPKGWKYIANNYEAMRNIYRNKNGECIDVCIDFEHVKQFWVEFFVRVHLKYKKFDGFNYYCSSMDKIKLKRPVFGIYDDSYYDTYYAEIYLSDIGDIDVSNKRKRDNVLKSYHASIGTNCYTKVASDEEIVKMISNVLVPGFVDYDGVYLSNSCQTVACGNPCDELHGEKWLLVNLKTPHLIDHNLVFVSWRITYDDC